jgi:cell division transport system permease protein
VIIVNTIKLAVYIRRTEINIMKYVGATDWFIRWPFVIEGTLIGIIGSFIPITICVLSYSKVIENIYAKFPIIKQLIEFKPFGEIFPVIVPIAIIVGIIIGTFGSLFSVHKHLQV